MEQRELTRVEGVVQSLIYKNDESGYSVARVMLTDGSEITVVGIMPFLGAGERISAVGDYVSHPQHGAQFSVAEYTRQMPASAQGIYEYLASRVVRGIGPKTARAIVERFGTDTFDILANSPEQLAQIRGITRDKARDIRESFLRLNAMRVLIEFLTTHGLPAYFVAPLLRLYGENAVEEIERNPYLLCDEAFGLPFETADRLAEQFGIAPDSSLRLDAALVYTLEFNLGNGHAFIPGDKLLTAAQNLCNAEDRDLSERLRALCDTQRLTRDCVAKQEVYYLSRVYQCECFLADEVKRLLSMRVQRPAGLAKMIAAQERAHAITYADKQRDAMCLCFDSALALVTGGPGTGKTTALLTMIWLLENNGFAVLLAAPTGRAAKRMSELCGREAKTLHRLLEMGPDVERGTLTFRRDGNNPLDADVIIVDEASMIDLPLAASLLRAMKPHTRLVLVGDADQLPPVGPGSFFADLLGCGCVPTVRLTEVFRQAQDSDIIMNAHSINRGEVPDLHQNRADFFFQRASTAEGAADTIVSLVSGRITSYFGIAPQDIQIICPSRQMVCGTASLNRRLQESLNPPSPEKNEVRFGSSVFRLGDRVMQIRNNYDVLWRKTDLSEVGSGVFNGDTGAIVMIDTRARLLTVRFDDREADYSFDELNQLEHAFAVTAHKSQGSEYEAVIIPVFSAPERLLNRNLLYTAVTRARRLLVLVGQESVVEKMVAANNKNRRFSALKRRIRERCDHV